MQDVPVYRAFIAIELPTPIKEALNAIIERLKEARPSGVRWVNPEGIHLTLKFLGDVPASRVEGIVEAMSQASTGIAPFILGLGEGGAFPSLKSPRVLWISMAGEAEPLHSTPAKVGRGYAKAGISQREASLQPSSDHCSTEGQSISAERTQGVGKPVKAIYPRRFNHGG